MEEPQEIPRNEGAKKLDDPKYHERMDWINSLEKEFPSVPYYFLDLITSYVQDNPEEAEEVRKGNISFEETKLDEWRKLAKK